MRFALLLLVLAGACATASSSVPPSSDAAAADAGAAAGAPVQAAPGRHCGARATQRKQHLWHRAHHSDRVRGVVLIEVQNAAPGEHGVHVHEKGDCSDPAAMSAGGHFNPKSAAHHGGPSTPVRHGGDLGTCRSTRTGAACWSSRSGTSPWTTWSAAPSWSSDGGRSEDGPGGQLRCTGRLRDDPGGERLDHLGLCANGR